MRSVGSHAHSAKRSQRSRDPRQRRNRRKRTATATSQCLQSSSSKGRQAANAAASAAIGGADRRLASGKRETTRQGAFPFLSCAAEQNDEPHDNSMFDSGDVSKPACCMLRSCHTSEAPCQRSPCAVTAATPPPSARHGSHRWWHEHRAQQQQAPPRGLVGACVGDGGCSCGCWGRWGARAGWGSVQRPRLWRCR